MIAPSSFDPCDKNCPAKEFFWRFRQLFVHATVPMPARVIDTEPAKCNAAAPHALSDRPCCNKSTISDEKVEKVVRPPQKPVITNSRHSGAIVVETTSPRIE